MKNTTRNGVIFNALSGGINAIQSVIWLMIITRVLGLTDAGIFTIAYATSNLFLMIGKYGIRNFQVSDVKKSYTWNDYYISRILTVIAMMAAALIYSLYMNLSGSYTIYKAIVVFLMTLLKAADAYEDVYYGMYQQNGRLDLAGLAMSIRLGGQLIFLSVCVLFKLDLLISLILTNIFSWVLLFILLKKFNSKFEFDNISPNKKRIKKIFILCAPLFLSSFVSYYVCNLSKYAIDRIMGEAEQAYYGFISMPVFVVFLFTNFIYQPMLKDISELWVEQKKLLFKKKLLSAVSLIGIISIIVLVGGWFLGVWGLGILYGVNMEKYKYELMVLLIGSVFYAFSAFFSVIITVMRKQKFALYVYVAVLIVFQFATTYLVKSDGIMGASLSYALSMGIVALLYLSIVVLQIRNMSSE